MTIKQWCPNCGGTDLDTAGNCNYCPRGASTASGTTPIPGTDGPTGLPAAQELTPEALLKIRTLGRIAYLRDVGAVKDPSLYEQLLERIEELEAPQAAAPGGVAPTPSLLEENKRLREVLTEAADFLRDGYISGLVRFDTAHQFNLVSRARTALRNGEPG